MSKKQTAIVIGAGIVGLAHARALASKGFDVTVIERSPMAMGASVRNFGMVWPIGQPEGAMFERAMRSRSVWLKFLRDTGLWYSQKGSLHIATHPLEAEVLQELADLYASDRQLIFKDKKALADIGSAINTTNALAGLYSPNEVIVEARQAIGSLPNWLEEKYGVKFRFGTAVIGVDSNEVHLAGETLLTDLVVVCNGADFETLFPEKFAAIPITRCKLQMMRLEAQPEQFDSGPALCGGLSLIHYKSFEAAPSFSALRSHFEKLYPQYLDNGIHVMACANETGEITVGDTHHYGLSPDPFDYAWLNDLVLDYLQQFACYPNTRVSQSWHGMYAKMMDGRTEWVEEVLPGIWAVNGLGGAGMTLSFGLAEEVADRIL